MKPEFDLTRSMDDSTQGFVKFLHHFVDEHMILMK